MEPDDPIGDDEPHSRLLPPEDRLWRHPSEVVDHGLPADVAAPRRDPAPQWLVAVVAGVSGAVLAVGVLAASGNLHRAPGASVAGSPTPTAAFASVTSPAPMTDVGRRLVGAVVRLEVEGDGTGPAGGAGVVFRADGHVLTTHDVVVGARRIVVVLADGRRVEARLVGADPSTDLAVVKVDGLDVPAAPMGSAARLVVGQGVMAVGPAQPGADPAIAVGVVGGLGRQVDRDGAPTLLDMIETSVALPNGVSGAPLVDGSGQVVGVTTAVTPAGGETAGGFAVPIEWARAVADQLVATGKVVRAWMGVEGSDLDPGTARQLGVDGGAVVTLVRDGSPAGEAGLAPTDVITAVDGVPVATMSALRLLLGGHRPGDVVSVEVRRAGDARTVPVRLAERPAQT